MTASPCTLSPIGYVHSPYRTQAEVPPWGGRAMIEVLDSYARGLIGIERSSHLFVLGFLHEADRSALLGQPRQGDTDPQPLGVFSCRSPARPNPVSLTIVRLLSSAGARLEVDGLDLVDGTPVIDLKPYNPGWDDVFCAQRRRRVRPSVLTDEQLARCLLRNLASYIGTPVTPDEALIAVAAVFVAVRRFDVDSRHEGLRVRTNRCGLTADALIGLLGASFASGRLTVETPSGPPRFVFTCGEEELLLTPHSDSGRAAQQGPQEWRRAFL